MVAFRHCGAARKTAFTDTARAYSSERLCDAGGEKKQRDAFAPCGQRRPWRARTSSRRNLRACQTPRGHCMGTHKGEKGLVLITLMYESEGPG